MGVSFIRKAGSAGEILNEKVLIVAGMKGGKGTTEWDLVKPR